MGTVQFHPAVQQWFETALGQPTPAQRQGWAAIAAGRHTLIAAPTGSGKTLAAFLTAIDDLFTEGLEAPLPDEVRVLYVSPLKALSTDIHKNLAEPRRGHPRAWPTRGGLAGAADHGRRAHRRHPAAERAAMLRTPPHILVTTPESLYLLLTSERSRQMLRTVRTVIVDEIHAVIGTRRGAHLALSLERLQHVAERPLLAHRPLRDAEADRGGGALSRRAPAAPPCAIVDEGTRAADGSRHRDAALGARRGDVARGLGGVLRPAGGADRGAPHDARLREHAADGRAPGAAPQRAARRGCGDRASRQPSKEKRLDAETRLKAGQLRALVATASLELGIDIGHVDLVCQIGSPHRIATLLQRVGRSGHTVARPAEGPRVSRSRATT